MVFHARESSQSGTARQRADDFVDDRQAGPAGRGSLMTSHALPPCRHRGAEFAAGRWTCSSPLLLIPARIVTAEVCACDCPYVDHALRDDLGNHAPISPTGESGIRTAVRLRPELVAVAMVTAPRPVQTVDRSLAELRRAGFQQTIHVFAEPKSDVRPDVGLRLTTHRRRKGMWRNWKFAARWMFERTDAPFILICEDDIELSPCAAWGLQHAIDTLPHESWGFASLYTPVHNVAGLPDADGWQDVPVRRGLWGALAYCFTREGLKEILQTHTVKNHRGPKGTDWIVSTAVAEAKRRCYFHRPSLGGHTGGGVSSVGHMELLEMAAVEFSPRYRRYGPELSQPLTGQLAVATSYFNPMRYESLRRNYRQSIDAMRAQGADVWTVEVAFGDDSFELEGETNTHCLRGGDVLWQKERALNVLVARLPPQYDKIAWIDADVVFSNQNWLRQTAQLLARHPVVQCFRQVHHLGPNGEDAIARFDSLASVVAERGIDAILAAGSTVGYAWAARRSVIAEHGLYDREIAGGNDLAMAIGFYGARTHPFLRTLPSPLGDDILRWTSSVWPAVQGHVGWVDGEILHLYHGPLKNRMYHQRVTPLCEHEFDPARDLKIGREGLWRWSSRKRRLHAALRRYFELRGDDE